MPSPGNEFLSDEFGDIEDYFISDYWLIDQYIGDQLWVWGANWNGQLGNNTTSGSGTPITTFAGGTNWKQVSTGSNSTAAIKTDGSLWVWGNNTYYQLGTTDNTTRLTPVTTFLGGNDWKQVSTGFTMMAAIKTDGSLWVWGRNNSGQLGNNTSGIRPTPVTTFLGGNDWKQVTCMGQVDTDTVMAIKTDGTLWGWGWNPFSVLGVNDSVNRLTPVTTFAGGNDWKQVSINRGTSAMAVKTDGSLWGWGLNSQSWPGNSSGQLGTNDVIDRPTPVTTFAGGNNWKQVSCGNGSSAAIKTDGSLWTWGSNSSGMLGIGIDSNDDSDNKLTPVTTFAGGNNWKSVDAQFGTMGAIKTDGSLWVWGSNSSVVLGINSGGASRLTPVTTFAGGNNWKQVNIGAEIMNAITAGLTVDFT